MGFNFNCTHLMIIDQKSDMFGSFDLFSIFWILNYKNAGHSSWESAFYWYYEQFISFIYKTSGTFCFVITFTMKLIYLVKCLDMGDPQHLIFFQEIFSSWNLTQRICFVEGLKPPRNFNRWMRTSLVHGISR